MALRASSDASVAKRSANVPLQAALSIAGWIYIASVPARFWGPLAVYAGSDGVPTSGTQYFQISSAASGSAQLQLVYGPTPTAINLVSVAANSWYFFALTSAGTAAGNLIAYVRALGTNAFTSVSNSGTVQTFTPGRMEWGRDGFTGDPIDGALGPGCAFDRVLDPVELTRLSYDLLRGKVTNRKDLNCYFPFPGIHNTWDMSGNARHPTMTVGTNFPQPRLQPARRRRATPTTSGAHNIAVGEPTETDTAFSVGKTKAKSTGLNTETDSVLALTRRRSYTVGMPSETSSALSLSRLKQKAAGLIAETDSAFSIVTSHFIAVGQAIATDTAFAVGRLKTKLLGLTTETDTANSATPTGPAPSGGAGWDWLPSWIRRRLLD